MKVGNFGLTHYYYFEELEYYFEELEYYFEVEVWYY